MLKQHILTMLRQRAAGKTICPSEVVRDLYPHDWRSHMDAVRAAARELVEQGRLEVTQKGQVVDPNEVKGPIRLRLPISLDSSKKGGVS